MTASPETGENLSTPQNRAADLLRRSLRPYVSSDEDLEIEVGPTEPETEAETDD